MSTDHINKVVHLGRTRHCGEVFCKITYVAGRLRITGVEGPKRDGDCMGSCGQIVVHLKATDVVTPAEGWTTASIAQFLETWNRWRLNDMRAGSPKQEAYLNTLTFPGYPMSYYEWAREELRKVGLHPDNGYLYGSAWLKEEVPTEVLAYLHALPESKLTPAWV